MTAEVLRVLDQAVKVDSVFAGSVSESTWIQYRRHLTEYAAWLDGNHRQHDWADPVVFAAFLKSLRTSKVLLVKRCTAISKVVEAAGIVGVAIANPTRTMAVYRVLTKAPEASGPVVEVIDSARRYQLGEAAELLGVSARTVRRRLDAGQFPDSRLVPGRTGQVWTIPGADLQAAFTTAEPVPARQTPVVDKATLERILGLIDTDTNIGARDTAALLLGFHSRLGDTALTRLRLGDIDQGNNTVHSTTALEPEALAPAVVADAVTAWAARLHAAGVAESSTLWPSINRGDRIRLNTNAVRVGDIARRRAMNAGITITGIASFK